VGVTTDDDGLAPARDETGHVLADDGLAEDGAAQDVTDGAVGRLPHLLQLELCARAHAHNQHVDLRSQHWAEPPQVLVDNRPVEL
jgi:hypothetical protein